ncbi:RidA family protein [Lysinibacillus fusiformis]|uniref:RidA family protein n=1 Tax=Lysinibacillus fusiformis TaxID=28031 RepID=UPI0023A9358F|nr:RidA family protein [Lysinibacillus fusiformis]WEA41248.1 RidA family protein [Lysinibacillus fusiformis]
MEILTKINTDKAPAAVGPYSQAVKVGNIVYTSGQISLSPDTGKVVGANVSEQAKQVMENLSQVLQEADASFESVIKTTCFLYDMNDFVAFNAVYEQYFKNKPARSCVAVKSLPKDVLCEIEVIALTSE